MDAFLCYNVVMVKTKPNKKSGQTVKEVTESKKDNLENTPKVSKDFPRRAMPAVMRVLIAMLFLVVFAGIFTWYILWQQNMGDVDATMQFLREKPILAGYSYVIILLLMCIIAAATWRPFFTIGVSFSLVSILMYINTQKFEYRNAPLLPEDFLMADQAGTIMQFIDPWSVTRLVLGVILVLVGSGIMEYGMRRIFGYGVFGREAKRKAWWERHSVVPRTAWALVALAGFLMFARPVLHYEDQGGEENAKWIEGIGFSHWNQKSDYAGNGFVVAFLYSLGGIHEMEPEGYGSDAIAKISKKYEDEGSKEHASLADTVDNVIVVLNESFIDPEILGETYEHNGGDVVPNLHKIFKEYPSGYMYSPGYGGGTANIEFEVLTSLSNYWAQTTPYVTTLSKMNYVPGVAKDAVDVGMTGTAIHAYDGSMYKRNAVYGRMGFKTFLDQNNMKHTGQENEGEYISDREIYNEALEVLENKDQKHVLMLATMQNHMPYDAAKYDTRHFRMMNQIDHTYEFESYLESIYHADEYLGEFIAELDKLEERTVVVWFGDHGPSLLSEYIDSGDPELIDLAHLTPYFIYANFVLDEIYTEKEVAVMNRGAGFEIDMDGIDLPVVTPNCLMSEMYKLLDVEMPPLVKLSSEVCEETPILAPTYSRNGEIKETETLKDYRLVNYDILSGKRYWLGL